jgi:hypothetical protein
MGAITGASPLEKAGFLLMMIALPVLFICLGILLAKGAKWAQKKPMAGLLAGIALGVSSLAQLLHGWKSHEDPKTIMWLIFYSLMVVAWPIWGVAQYRAKKEQIRTQPQ